MSYFAAHAAAFFGLCLPIVEIDGLTFVMISAYGLLVIILMILSFLVEGVEPGLGAMQFNLPFSFLEDSIGPNSFNVFFCYIVTIDTGLFFNMVLSVKFLYEAVNSLEKDSGY
eukprot:Filipodium_phascolosomae@DN7675_c0_g1_i1.p1